MDATVTSHVSDNINIHKQKNFWNWSYRQDFSLSLKTVLLSLRLYNTECFSFSRLYFKPYVQNVQLSNFALFYPLVESSRVASLLVMLLWTPVYSFYFPFFPDLFQRYLKEMEVTDIGNKEEGKVWHRKPAPGKG